MVLGRHQCNSSIGCVTCPVRLNAVEAQEGVCSMLFCHPQDIRNKHGADRDDADIEADNLSRRNAALAARNEQLEQAIVEAAQRLLLRPSAGLVSSLPP